MSATYGCIQTFVFMGLHKELALLFAKIGNFRVGERSRGERLRALSLTHAKLLTRLARNLCEARDEFRQRTKERNLLIAKVGKLEKEQATLRYVPKLSDKKIQELKSQTASDAKAFAHLVLLVIDQRSNWFCMTAGNGELRRLSSKNGREALQGSCVS